MSSRIHQATSAAPKIDSVIALTSRTPFTEELTEVKLREMDKLRLPGYKPGGDPVEHLTAFNIAVARARLDPEERDAGYCQLFVETLNEQALTWFSGLEENSISSFKELSSAFLKTYIVFTKREATASTLWNLKQTKDQSLRDYMERFKSVVSRINIPDHIAVDALRNNLLVECKFREDLYRTPTSSLHDAVARSQNFIRMEEDTKAIMSKHNSAKQLAPKNAATTHVEPRQHAPSDKHNRKNGLLYIVDENGKKWNTFHRETDPPSESPQATAAAAVAQVDSVAGPSRTPPGLTKSCKLHGVKGHDTSECKTLFTQFLSSIESGELKLPPPKPKSESSWSRNKDRKNQRKNQGKPRQDDQKPKDAEQTPRQDDDGDVSADEDQPAVRQRIEVIRAQPESSSDEESELEEAPDSSDLRMLLKRKATPRISETPGPSDLRVEHNAKRTKHAPSQRSSPASPDDNPIVDLRDQLNARMDDLLFVGTIHLSVQAERVTRTVKFSVVSTKAPYHVILGTPWLYSMRAIASTYHQCVKFPGMDGTIKTVRGDQRATRDLLIATVKLQCSQSLVNSVSPPISKVCPQKEEVLEVPIDESDPSKVLRVGAYLSDEMQRAILDFLKQNLSTFAWSMSDMRGIDPS
ncbi:PREDICTED: uncharacterized protein LOC106338282 [Brassica oleracea var. oleracea]|uniref:uncharacterized protein LOC106338282 n=1 Tax=Brassica oleracea var. oleracea TaxID=109376 RepID=UPI0006A71C6B|nr:PREDICTED: uncharacterized protein LOC106338282 [Brassica oleracea var. oleracea]